MKNTNYPRKAISLLLAMIMLFGAMPLNIIALDDDASVTIQYNGADASSVNLIENGKVLLKADPTYFIGDVKYQWQILADAEKDLWIDISDRRGAECDVTYALVKSCLDRKDRAYLRVRATSGDVSAISDPVRIDVSYLVNTNASTNVVENTKSSGENTKSLLDDALDLISMPISAAEGSTSTITITFLFLKVVNGVKIEIAYPDIRTVTLDYDAYTVNCPTVLGYQAPQASYTVEKGQYVSNTTIEVIYTAMDMEYTVKHWIQNVEDDQYTELTEGIPTNKQTGVGKVDSVVPDCHLTESELEGFEVIYYEHPSIAPDGSTVVDIYYDRVYYQVLFNYDEVQASGQNNVYVRYGTNLGVNKLESPGDSYIFQGWELTEYNDGDIAAAPAGVLKSISGNATEENRRTLVLGKLEYKALWELGEYDYTVLFWAENANDGNYSLWYSKKMDNPEEKTTITWDDGFLTYLEEYDEGVQKDADGNVLIGTNGQPVSNGNSNPNQLEFFTFDEVKTKNEIGEGVAVRGDGTTVINVFYARRYYQVTYYVAENNSIDFGSHTHGDGTCEYNPFYCTHIHTDECKSDNCSLEEHTHTIDCKNCSKNEHIHGPECCNVHMHTTDCYSYDTPLAEGFKKDASIVVENYIDDTYGNIWGIGGIISTIVNWVINDQASTNVSNAMTAIQQKAPPQNLQNGYVYVLEDQPVPIKYDGFIINIDDSVPMDIPVIYIDGQWYYYTSPDGTYPNANEVLVLEANTCPENAPNHDHTGGCVYDDCAVEEHIHSDENGCYDCGLAEHTHSDNCSCIHEHNEDCFGYLCMKPTADTEQREGLVPIKVLQAKYGQDITEHLPYYLELYQDGLHQNSSGDNFVYWKYDSTGTDDSQSKGHYVKHLTMEAELCYSNGTGAVAQYDPNARNAYILYYLFESLDQSDENVEKDYSIDGTARKKVDGVWYDSDPKHVQLVTYNSAGSKIDGGSKTIHGMQIHQGDQPIIGTLTFNIDGNDTEVTLNAYFYDRIRVNVSFKNPGDESITEIEVPYGTSMGTLSQLFVDKMGEDWVTDPDAYPKTLEKDAYEFDSWFTTPEYAELSKIDWQTDTVSEYTQYLYARWLGVWRKVEIFTDSSMEKKIDLTNSAGEDLGTQLRRHRGFAEEPSHDTLNPAYGTADEAYYKFSGWFYKDEETGEERAFNFDFAITEDIKIYPKWSSSVKIEYKVNYVTEVAVGDGSTVYVEIAPSYVSTAILAQNITVVALTGDNLYEEYRQGYFPIMGSSTIHISSDSKDNEYTFVYKQTHSPLEYRVEYVDAETGEELHEPKIIETMKNAETELFIPVEGYTVDKYAKTVNIVYYDKETEETPNVIVFEYTKDLNEEPQQAPWSINHYVQNVDGSYSRIDPVTETTSDVDTVQGGKPLDNLAGYTFVKVQVFERTDDHPDGITTDIPEADANGLYSHKLGAYGMEINFYYDRNPVNYTIQYVWRNVDEFGNISIDVQEEDTLEIIEQYVHGETVTHTPDESITLKYALDGYTLMEGYESQSLVLDVDSSRNVISFYYQKWKSTFIYQIVAPEGSGVGISMSREEINASPNTGEVLNGSIPYENDKYYFAGWFKDEECTQPIDANVDPVTLDGNRLTPTMTSFEYEGVAHELYVAATYYALFLPRNADTTISVESEFDGDFIIHIVGSEGLAQGTKVDIALQNGDSKIVNLPVGKYTVVVDSDWSWRYGVEQVGEEAVGITLQIEVVVSGDNEFALVINEDTYGAYVENYKNSQWLDANGYNEYIPD